MTDNSLIARASGSYNTAIGNGAGGLLTSGQYCVLMGTDAGADLTDQTGVVIIGDGIRDLDPEHNKDVLFIGYKVAIGRTLFGQPINLRDVLESFAGGFGDPFASARVAE